jgi:DNA-binding IclR family transcriptional regulator
VTPPDSDGFDALPPSAKYVYHVLEEADGELTRQELLEETDLHERTLDRALKSLQNGDFIALDRDTGDLRQIVANVASTRTL